MSTTRRKGLGSYPQRLDRDLRSERTHDLGRDHRAAVLTGCATRVCRRFVRRGGTGSGSSLDVVFGLRRLMAEMNLSDEQLTLILAHSDRPPRRQPRHRMANTYACLSELRTSAACRFTRLAGL